MRTPKFEIKQVERCKTNYWSFIVPGYLSPSGVRKRLYFKTKSEAEDVRSQYVAATRGGEAPLPPKQAAEAKRAIRLISEAGVEMALDKVVEWALKHLILAGAKLSVVDLLAEFYTSKQDTWSQKSKSNFRYASAQLAAEFGELSLVSLLKNDLEDWLASRFPRPVYRKHMVATLRPSFNYAVRRGYISASPFADISIPRVRARKIAILSPADVRCVLDACPADCVAAFSLLAFAGIRPEELTRLRWADIRLEEGFVHVSGDNSKTAQARNVEVLPALHAWLSSTGHHEPTEKVCPPNWKRKQRLVRSSCGVYFSQQDMFRHSFASYHLCAFKDEGRTKAAMGHSRASDTLFINYRAAVTQSEARAFWAIYP